MGGGSLLRAANNETPPPSVLMIIQMFIKVENKQLARPPVYLFLGEKTFLPPKLVKNRFHTNAGESLSSEVYYILCDQRYKK